MRGLQRVTGGLLALLVVGCGLAKYEEEMRATQERVARYDEEAAVLGDRVAIPTKRVAPKETTKQDPGKKEGGKDDKKAAPKEAPKEERKPVIDYPFFFRVPRGIRATPDLEPVGGLAYRYPRTGGAAQVSAIKPGATPVAPKTGTTPDLPVVGGSPSGLVEVFLAFGNEPAGIFADKVVKALPRSSDAVTASSHPVAVMDRRDSLDFDVREFSDAQTAWSVFVHSENGATVAVIYRMEKTRKGSLDRIIDLSLATLAMAQEAGFVADSYAKYRR